MEEIKNIEFNSDNSLLSITDIDGKIEYCSDEFVELTGFTTVDFIGNQHNVLRHPDMPKSMYKYIWDRLKKEEEVIAVIKNLTKDGSHYWALVNFYIRYDDNNNVIGYKSFRKPVPKNVVEAIIPIYQKLIYLEEHSDLDLAMAFFYDYFKRRKTNYGSFINKLLGITDDQANVDLSNSKGNLKNRLSFKDKLFKRK